MATRASRSSTDDNLLFSEESAQVTVSRSEGPDLETLFLIRTVFPDSEAEPEWFGSFLPTVCCVVRITRPPSIASSFSFVLLNGTFKFGTIMEKFFFYGVFRLVHHFLSSYPQTNGAFSHKQFGEEGANCSSS